MGIPVSDRNHVDGAGVRLPSGPAVGRTVGRTVFAAAVPKRTTAARVPGATRTLSRIPAAGTGCEEIRGKTQRQQEGTGVVHRDRRGPQRLGRRADQFYIRKYRKKEKKKRYTVYRPSAWVTGGETGAKYRRVERMRMKTALQYRVVFDRGTRAGEYGKDGEMATTRCASEGNVTTSKFTLHLRWLKKSKR